MGPTPSIGSPPCRQRVLAPILTSRLAAGLLSGSCFLLLLLRELHVTLWSCPLQASLSFPCPGCGLGRSVAAAAHGELGRSFGLHAFGPLVLVVLALAAVAAVLPGRPRAVLAGAVARAEALGVSTLLLWTFVAYWLARVLLLPDLPT
jgi:hypothetical protein